MAEEKMDFQDLMKLAEGFEASRIFLVANEIDLFTLLSKGPMKASAIAGRLRLHERALEIFMNALVAMNLLVKGPEGYSNSPLTQRFLVIGEPTYKGHLFKHMSHTFQSWAELPLILKEGKPKEDLRQKLFFSDTEINHLFIWAMDDFSRERAPEVLKNLDLKGVKNMLDVGSGPATYPITFAKAFPQLRVTAFDLPMATKIANENIARHGMQERVKAQAGDFLKDDLGRDYDMVFISNIIHGYSEEESRALIKKALSALKPGGRIIIHDFFLEEDMTTPAHAALFSVLMLVVTPHGRSYNHKEVSEWLRGAGFQEITLRKASEISGLLIGQKSL